MRFLENLGSLVDVKYSMQYSFVKACVSPLKLLGYVAPYKV